jgi:hemerythrin-like domain-containing protein
LKARVYERPLGKETRHTAPHDDGKDDELMDAIKLIKRDHDTVEALFKRFEAAGSKAYKTKRQIADRVIEELTVHAAIEEQVLYPAMERLGGEFSDLVHEADVEHAEAKNALRAMVGLSGDDPLLDAKMSALIGGVRHHVKEEEEEMLPKFKKALSREELDSLGEQLQEAKKTAPRSAA